MKTKDERLFIRITTEQKEQLEQIAEHERRSMSNVARLAIEQYIQREQEKSA
jgi:predicted transcriptional regulator